MVDKGRSVAALVSAKYCLGEKNLIGETSPKTPQKKGGFYNIFHKIIGIRFFGSFEGHKGHLMEKILSKNTKY